MLKAAGLLLIVVFVGILVSSTFRLVSKVTSLEVPIRREQSRQQKDERSERVNRMKSSPVVIDFADPAMANLWRSIDDTVMGGVSQGDFEILAEGIGVFSGELSLENNGGFSSVRRNVSDLDFSGVEAIALRVKGDGRRYQLRFSMDRSVGSDARTVFYKADFDTQPNQWQTISLPLRSFEPVFRGRMVEDAPALAAERIQEIGLLLAGEQSGEFRLEIDWIEGG